MKKMDMFLLCAFTFLSVALLGNAQDPVVSGELGEIFGKTITIPIDWLPYRDVNIYRGIPFAEPPVGERRFRKPEPKEELDSPFYAHNFSAICSQSSFFAEATDDEQSEDCLYLNVYVPVRPADGPNGHAVMIWVYGGGFIEGSANTYDGTLLSVAGNIIVVTFNYRLGAFGFLSTGDDHAPGNVGLWDQRMAFQWVHDNIGDFGGDNLRVTIAGESAGAISTTLHSLVPDNYGLFQRVIAQSGSITIPSIDLERDTLREAGLFASQLDCPTSVVDMMKCLREKSVDEILTSSVFFNPAVDGDLMKINPQHMPKMAEDWNLNEVEFLRSLDILTGFNAYEGAFLLPYIIDPTMIETIRPTREEMREMYIPALLGALYRKEYAEELTHLVETQYTNWSNPDAYDTIRLQLTKMAGDMNFAIPAMGLSRMHKMSSASSNFMYHFTPKPSVRTMPTPTWIPGANHADEIPFMFGVVGSIGVGSENAWELELVTQMMTYWTNFVKSGDPNSPEMMSPYWPGYTIEDGAYIRLARSTTAEQHFYAKEANFWLDVFPELAEAMQDKDKDDCVVTAGAAAISPVSKAVVAIASVILSFVFAF